MTDSITTDDLDTAAEPDGDGAAAPADVAPIDLAPLATAADGEGPVRDLRLLADIDVELSVELGRATVPMRQLLSLHPGGVIELDRAAGGAVDLLVNGRVVARGEVVVCDGKFGVRVSELAPSA